MKCFPGIRTSSSASAAHSTNSAQSVDPEESWACSGRDGSSDDISLAVPTLLQDMPLSLVRSWALDHPEIDVEFVVISQNADKLPELRSVICSSKVAVKEMIQVCQPNVLRAFRADGRFNRKSTHQKTLSSCMIHLTLSHSLLSLTS